MPNMRMITELAEKSGFWIDSYDKNIYLDRWSTGYINPELKLFTEFLVLECAAKIQEMVDHRIPASEYPEKLKSHFDIA
jgi:hypothetical protein